MCNDKVISNEISSPLKNVGKKIVMFQQKNELLKQGQQNANERQISQTPNKLNNESLSKQSESLNKPSLAKKSVSYHVQMMTSIRNKILTVYNC